MWVAWRRSRGILLGKFSRHQRFKLGSLQAVAAKCIQISWHSPHSSGSKWILCSKNSKLNFCVSGSPYIFGSDVFGHKSSCRKVKVIHTFAWLHWFTCYRIPVFACYISWSMNSVLFGSFFSICISCSFTVRCWCIVSTHNGVVVFFKSLVWLCTPQIWKFPHLSHQPLSHEGTAAKSKQSKNIHSHMTSKPEANARLVNVTHTWHDLAFK